MFYGQGNSLGKTHDLLREKYPGAVSYRVLRSFIQSSDMPIKHYFGFRGTKRWIRNCMICKNDFQGRTPTVLVCDDCGGTTTKSKQVAYHYWHRLQDVQKKFGLDKETYEAGQRGCCGLCGKLQGLGAGRSVQQGKDERSLLCLDHDHANDKFRGFLCHKCNLLLGQIERTGGTIWMDKAIEWLNRTK